ncbi:DUF3871 family protein [Maribacter algicola]|uniref:DUF3871 family protein n=1 Tax=Maribacter algicola TaxID=2498892 RepID=A0A3R8R1C9_9FLAO|nr:DUF3871 family protein [Maribacter algicola]RRQ49810.1 DUF3871 family protein [Maribacter algicola]
MELVTNQNPQSMIQDIVEPTTISKSPFIEANTEQVTLQHLKDDCIIPVFSKDNESTISHSQFIGKAFEAVQELFPQIEVRQPDIRVSHVVKGRIPSAIGKPAKELLESEKTIYYERCAFIIDLPGITRTINGNALNLSVGGVRSLNQENLYSKKSLEKFKVFIGFKNLVCTNLCISTDGFSNEIRIGSIDDLKEQMHTLFSSYNQEQHFEVMAGMESFRLTERQFAHFIGKLRMYHHMDKLEQKELFPIQLNDGQINSVVKNYYTCSNFGRNQDGSINFWKLYNLLTEANKSSYIDNNLERNVSAFELVKNLGDSLKNNEPNWFLHN